MVNVVGVELDPLVPGDEDDDDGALDDDDDDDEVEDRPAGAFFVWMSLISMPSVVTLDEIPFDD